MKTPSQLVDFCGIVPELALAGPEVEDHHSIYTRREMELLAKYALQIPVGGTAVEIGVYIGHTAQVLLNLQKDLDLKIFLIDCWGWRMPDSRRTFEKVILDHFPEVPFAGMWMTSQQAYDMTHGMDIDFIHIDGDHDYNGRGVDWDCRFWLPRLASGGAAVFHDADHGPVMKAIEEFCPGWEGERAGRTVVRIKP